MNNQFQTQSWTYSLENNFHKSFYRKSSKAYCQTSIDDIQLKLGMVTLGHQPLSIMTTSTQSRDQTLNFIISGTAKVVASKQIPNRFWETISWGTFPNGSQVS